MLAAFAAYLFAHFAAYVLVVRRLDTFRTERGIFFYHIVSAISACLVAAIAAYIDLEGFGLEEFVIIFSVHGIYSLSFLEVWSLSQGGYSLSILAEVERANSAGTDPDFSTLVNIGHSKQVDRISGLDKLSLVNVSDSRLNLTPRGVLPAKLLYKLRRWVDPVHR